MTDHDLETLERQTFRTAVDDGLWDVFLAVFFSMFAFAPLLSETLGDFWSSVVFLPLWLVTYMIIGAVRRGIVRPRVGTVRLGPDRLRRMRNLSILMLIVNVVAAVLGVVAAIGVQLDWIDLGDDRIGYPLGLGVVLLVGFSGAAHVTGIARYYVYGLMLAGAPMIGEWLWRNDLASHHGYPIVFGVAAAIVLIAGIARFVSVLRNNPLPKHPATV